jgi:uncharacterized membrane protein
MSADPLADPLNEGSSTPKVAEKAVLRTMGVPSLKDPCYVNAMIHFYRGELGRIMVLRQRLDVTTTWAITTSTTIITVAFSFPEIPHIIFFFNLALVWIMLWIEGRRFRHYVAFRGRVRMLESHFLMPMVAQSEGLLEGEWRRLVCEDLVLPYFKMSRLEAVCRRLKRNYVYIFCVVLLAWVLKIFMHAKNGIYSVSDFLTALGVAGLPIWLAEMVFIPTVIGLVLMMSYALRYTDDEISEFGSHNPLWKL